MPPKRPIGLIISIVLLHNSRWDVASPLSLWNHILADRTVDLGDGEPPRAMDYFSNVSKSK